MQSFVFLSRCARQASAIFSLAIIFVTTLGITQTARAAAPAPTTGVTVLVHGFTPLNGVFKPPVEYWGANNIVDLLKRFGSGLVWLYNPSNGIFENISHDLADGKPLFPTNGWFRAFAGEQVLLFDWTDVSDEVESGQAEAAADALFAALMRFRVDGKPIISSSPYHAVRPLHFIGHSRGTVVVSETVQRLGRFNIRVNYVTYLDIHDFGQPDIPNDEYFHDPAVQVWENIDYVDVAFQNNPPTMCWPNPAGRPLDHVPFGPLQRDLTVWTMLDLAGCNEHERPHSWIKEYYWGTVATNGGTTSRPAVWYGGGDGKGYGFDRWLALGGYDQPPLQNLTRVKSTVGSEAASFAFHWDDDMQNDRGHPDPNTVPPVLFNGDFETPDLDRGIGSSKANSLAGWTFFGGGGSAWLRPTLNLGQQPENSFIQLDGQANTAIHNRFYLPTTAWEIRFALTVAHVPLLGDHTLEVLIGNRLLRRFTVGEVGGPFVRTASLAGHSDLLSGVNTLTFKLNTSAGIVNPSAVVEIDNISIPVRPFSWIDSFSRNANQDWEISWRSWPAGRFQLESKSESLDSPWSTVSTSNSASAGLFSVNASDDDLRFFRLREIP
jgi:hypothetical protein